MQLRYEQIQPQEQVTSSVIWLHGLGASGHDFMPAVPFFKKMQSHGVRFLFPHAPNRPVTINGGISMPAWYDIKGLDLASKEDQEGISDSVQSVSELIHAQIQQGIAPERIFLFGFSQGGAIALHTAFSLPFALAGVAVLSSYLPLPNYFQAQRSEKASSSPVFMAHGVEDEVVPLALGKMARDRLMALGIAVQWQEYTMEHSVLPEELIALDRWADALL